MCKIGRSINQSNANGLLQMCHVCKRLRRNTNYQYAYPARQHSHDLMNGYLYVVSNYLVGIFIWDNDSSIYTDLWLRDSERRVSMKFVATRWLDSLNGPKCDLSLAVSVLIGNSSSSYNFRSCDRNALIGNKHQAGLMWINWILIRMQCRISADRTNWSRFLSFN